MPSIVQRMAACLTLSNLDLLEFTLATMKGSGQTVLGWYMMVETFGPADHRFIASARTDAKEAACRGLSCRVPAQGLAEMNHSGHTLR